MQFIHAPSPNFNDRKRPVSLIVLHYTGMKDGPSALARMCDPSAEVSAHYMVEEDGRVFRLVEEDKRAWHAGVSYWQGERDINSASIGVEIVNGGHDFGLPAYPEAQIEAVITLVSGLMARWNIPPINVIGHSDIAPDRKQDPGEHFPWGRLEASGCAISPATGTPATFDASQALTVLGYDPSLPAEVRIAAFQRRWRPSCVDGQADEETLNLLARTVAMS